MKKTGIAAAVLAALMLAGPASAQGKKGKGGGGFGGPFGLLNNKDVQKDLKLSDDQIAMAKELATKQQEAFKKLKGLDKEEAAEKIKELRADAKKKLDELLKPDQAKRLDEIQLQQAGPFAFFNPKVIEKLELSDEQKEKIQEVIKESFQKRLEIFKEFKDDREAMQKKLAEMNKAIMSEIRKSLKEDQKSEFKKMLGAPFKGALPPPGFGGFGRDDRADPVILAAVDKRRFIR